MSFGKCINALDVGNRVWTENGFLAHGPNRVDVPVKTGGTITSKENRAVFAENYLYYVRWDSGHETAHYSNELFCIGQSDNPDEFRNLICNAAVRAKTVVGPKGGLRSCAIYLKNGDWVHGMSEVVGELQSKGVEVETQRIPRQKRGSL